MNGVVHKPSGVLHNRHIRIKIPALAHAKPAGIHLDRGGHWPPGFQKYKCCQLYYTQLYSLVASLLIKSGTFMI